MKIRTGNYPYPYVDTGRSRTHFTIKCAQNKHQVVAHLEFCIQDKLFALKTTAGKVLTTSHSAVDIVSGLAAGEYDHELPSVTAPVPCVSA